jgi:hypothetical protein
VKTITFLLFFLPVTCFGSVEASPPNWSGRYVPCNHHNDLLSRRHVDLAVRISTSNTVLAQQFEKAMEFWAGVLDLEWHPVAAQQDCAIQLVDGTPSVFDFCTCLSARSQFPDRPGFQGWIAFNPRVKLTEQEMFLDSVHEIGHLLGLPHNSSDSSVMFYLGTDKPVSLDAADLKTLAARHQLRSHIATNIPVVVAKQTAERGRSWSQGIAWWRRPFHHRSSAGLVASALP